MLNPILKKEVAAEEEARIAAEKAEADRIAKEQEEEKAAAAASAPETKS